MPRNVEKLKEILSEEYGGDPVAYVNDKHKDFRSMGCRGRNDLIQALFDAGLEFHLINLEPRKGFVECAMKDGRAETIERFVDPDTVSLFEDDMGWTSGWGDGLTTPIKGPLKFYLEPEILLLMLQRGASIMHNHDDYKNLTREEQLLLAADFATKHSRKMVPIFREAGYGRFIELAKNQQAVAYVNSRAGKNKGSGGSGFLGSLAGLAAGAAIGGDIGNMLALENGLGALDSGSGESNGSDFELDGSQPLPIPTQRATLGFAYEPSMAPRRGMMVIDVAADSLANFYGLQKGDVVTSIADTPVAHRGSVLVATEAAYKLQDYPVVFFRGDERHEVNFSLADLKAKQESVAESPDTNTKPSQTAVNATESKIAALERIASLYEQELITEAEYNSLKADILDQP